VMGLLLRLGPRGANAQTQYFEMLPYRNPTQCERMQCLSVRLDYCREHREGFYLKEKGCPGEQICTNCVYGNTSNDHHATSQSTICYCENPPYSVPVNYGEECNSGKVCKEGQGMCYRPCSTYLHSTLCPTTHCMWKKASYMCLDKPQAIHNPRWMDAPYSDTVRAVAQTIVDTADPGIFPVDFVAFRASADGYRIQGRLLENITELETMFLLLDSDNDGLLEPTEYAGLPNLLASLDATVSKQAAATAQADALAQSEAEQDAQMERRLLERRLQSNNSGPIASSELCGVQVPRKYFCSFDVSCKEDCKECGWKSSTDEAFSVCVRPSPERCRAQGPPPGEVYCKSDDSCHPSGDCNACVDRPVVDHSQSICLARWWSATPLTQWTNWVCRYRNKNGMPCRHDQDCVFGLRRCIGNICQPKQPYNANHTCEADEDCPHLNYYCPRDPTGGENPYWVQYCRAQRSEGMTCAEDRECAPELRCNHAEPQPRCRRFFSLAEGMPAADDMLCAFGWRDRNNDCAPPAKSKQAGRSCSTNRDCLTTDVTGRPGRCVCKSWWERDDAKYCEPVAGDYVSHQVNLRNYMWFRVSKCGRFWTEEECLRIFANEALRLKLTVECETQELSGGPFLPPADCGIVDEMRFGDSCAKLAALQ